MKFTVIALQIILSLTLVATILLQQRGSGLGDAFGGGGTVYRSKRGFERTLHLATIVIAVLFVATAIGSLFVN